MHRQLLSIVVLVLLLIITFNESAFSQSNQKMSQRLQRALEVHSQQESIVAWVFFRDKGRNLNKKLDAAESSLSPHAYQRRLRSRGTGNLVDYHDLQVVADYIDQIASRVSGIRHKSRWLNAVSVEASGNILADIAHLPFVKKMDLVFRTTVPFPQEPIPISPSLQQQFDKRHTLDYGPSFTQNNQINVPSLHDSSLTGAGVIIAMLDAGFNNLDHEALDHLDIMATRDFVNGDDVVSDEPAQMGTGDHGTWTLSALAGFAPGNLIGPAYGASFLLAKTENTDWERHIEEDHWVAAAEWADNLGADIISSSLGYRNGFTHGEPDYTWEDMDGNTTIVTRGADIAASRGILVVTSAGNDGPAQPPQNTLGGPADGDSVLSVGAVDLKGSRVSFSSMGPTADGRTKPDVMAMGERVFAASASQTTGYVSFLSGTSMSCPLVAGTAALLMQANPQKSNMEVLNALRETASQANNPDNAFGWGIVNATRAIQRLGNTGIKIPERLALLPNFPNPFNDRTIIRYDLPQSGQLKITIFDVLGRKVTTLVDGFKSASSEQKVLWTPRNRASGVYFVVMDALGEQHVRKILLVK